jgi:PadR family transcriptional regulator, regulatory protein AphA
VSTNPRTSHPRRVLSPEYALLGLLMDGPSHGYDLHQRLSAELGNVWHVSQSQAYSILKRLEERGDITARTDRKAKLPRRQVLHITPTGRRRFRQWLDGTANSGARTVRLEFLTRLYFAELLAPQKVASIHADQEREVAKAIRRLRLLVEQVPEGRTFNRMSLDLRLRQMELVRTWLQDVRASLGVKPGIRK